MVTSIYILTLKIKGQVQKLCTFSLFNDCTLCVHVCVWGGGGKGGLFFLPS